MKTINDVMTKGVQTVHPEQTIGDAASRMAAADIGSLPVAENDRLIGMITDRDIVLRAVALNLDPRTPVRDVMSEQVKYCFDDADVASVAENMADLGVRRLPVVDQDKRLVGMVALSNLAYSGDGASVHRMLQGVAAPH